IALASDSKFRKYASLVERTLLSIDQVNEWADFITFLAKLLKTLQSHPHYPIIPHKLTIAKRLSQCLNPALPQGVHQRALDVYGYILTTIGPDGLRRDLQVWSAGLFPFFQYAATAVRPIVLKLFENFYLPLQSDLRPAMKAFILALLPGLEEETGEHFDHVCSLLGRLSGTVSLPFFLQNLWLVLIAGPGYRIPAINFLSRRIPPLNDKASITPVVGEDVGLMIRGYSAALEDANILVQRGILDLLLTNLKLDSFGFRSDARHHDQLLLTRAALGVVLRRDLSLSRRLYTWLLGPSPAPEDVLNQPLTYFLEFGLELVAESLREDMKAEYANVVVERQRPFKIYIALLDKWEIGVPLTKVLVLDAFRALKDVLTPQDTQDELLLTANMLFDSLDPFITWKSLFETVNNYIIHHNANEDCLDLIKFIITTFRIHDEEHLRIHIPLVAYALIDIVDAATTDSLHSFALIQNALEVTTALLQELSENFDTNLTFGKPNFEFSSLSLARRFYSAENLKEVDAADLSLLRDSSLYSNALSAIMRIVTRVAANLSAESSSQMLNASLTVLEALLAFIRTTAHQVVINWLPLQSIGPLLLRLRDLELDAAGFQLFEKALRVMLSLAEKKHIEPPLALDDQMILSSLVVKLLDFLQGKTAPFFLQAVKMIWELQKMTKARHVESIISSRLTSKDQLVRVAAFEAFGNLWRYSEEGQLPGAYLRIPMLLVLDNLKSTNLTDRRCAEAWMRCSLKSYLRVLDPLFGVFLSSEIKRKPFELELEDRSIRVYHYIYPFDQDLVQHTLESLLTLVRFGGQGFTRMAKTCLMKHSHDAVLRQLLQPAGLESLSYLDGLIKMLLLFINSDPSPNLAPAMSSQNQNIHAASADMLQVLISRGDIASTDLVAIEETLNCRLLISIKTSDYNLQNKLLHALHATINVASPAASSSAIVSDLTLVKAKPGHVDLTLIQLFALVVGDGITSQSNSAIVHQWIDFLLMTVPQIRRSLDDVVNPLIDRLVNRLRSLVLNIEETYAGDNKGKSPQSEFTDSEFSIFVNAIERLVIVAIEAGESNVNLGEASGSKSNTERVPLLDSTGGLFAGVFNVLGSSETSQQLPQDRQKTNFQIRLGNVVFVLMKAWGISHCIHNEKEPESSSSMQYFSARVKLRTRKAFERLYKAVPNEIIEAVIDYWQSEIATNTSDEQSSSEDIVFLLLDHLAPSAQTIISMVYERLAVFGHSATTEKVRGAALISFLPEHVLFAFLESYAGRLEGPIAVQTWNSSLSFVRDVATNSTVNKNQVFPTLKCFTILAEKISQTSALEDRRMRRDLQDTFVKLCDTVTQAAGKYVEQNKDKPEVNGEALGDTSEKEIPSSPVVTSGFLVDDRKLDLEKPATGLEIALFLSEKALPGCRRFLIESDKLQTICVNIMYYLVTPALKARNRSLELETIMLGLLVEMTKHSAASRAWRTYVADSFADAKFFNYSPETGRRWKPIIQALLTTDKERFTEMLSRLSTVPSTNIFTNKEAEAITRALSLRRITYAIYAAEYNRFLVHLPSIQEKVVDLLRSNVGEIVHAEVYLCMRVLLCRIANQHLGSFWPVILTEMTRFFEGMIESIPDNAGALLLALSASKFLDLLLVLQTQDFQIHQWMFITDTVDAMYPPDSWFPHAIIDRLAEILRESLSNQLTETTDLNEHSPPPLLQSSPLLPRLVTSNLSQVPSMGSLRAHNSSRTLSPLLHGSSMLANGRRPLLSRTKKIDSIKPLERFFSKISLMNYEACYAGGAIDWETVEADLESDLFDGKDS
ncbi:hypothetical protein O181_010223, partial [Austropuccinia psidii MF-1]|nr:hypothetical protein [Austropuccinia psidii MF-1]